MSEPYYQIYIDEEIEASAVLHTEDEEQAMEIVTLLSEAEITATITITEMTEEEYTDG